MKSRIVKTNIWLDDEMLDLPTLSRYFFQYLLTCPYIELTGIFKLPHRHALTETGLTESEFSEAAAKLQKIKKAFFYKEWVYIVKTDLHNKYSVSKKTVVAFDKELQNIPKDISDHFLKHYPYVYPIDTLSIPLEDRRQKTEDRNNKEEDIKQNQHVKDFLEAI